MGCQDNQNLHPSPFFFLQKDKLGRERHWSNAANKKRYDTKKQQVRK